MHWLHAIDVGLLRFVNESLSNPVLDVLMPIASGQGSKAIFLVLAGVSGLWLAWKGGRRGRLCVAMAVLIVASCDGLLCNTIKHAVGRPRPYVVLPDLNRPGGRSRPAGSMPETVPAEPASKPAPVSNNSMPSSHAANWFAASMVFFVYYRRSWKFTLPAALVVSFSRIYNGVHYPSDVCAGALLGAGYAVAALWAIQTLWHSAGQRWFPSAFKSLPSLVDPNLQVPSGRRDPGTADGSEQLSATIR